MPPARSTAHAPAPHRGDRLLTALAIIALIVLVALPILTHPLPPLDDYPNHLARQHIIANLAQNHDLARYYIVDWAIIPNIAMDLLVPSLIQAIGTFAAGQVFMLLVLATVTSGTLVLNRALIGRWSVLPLLALPFFYNFVFLVGTLNYLLGIGLALFALASWILLAAKPAPWRLLASAAFVTVLFFCHLFAVGLYGLGLLALETQRLLRAEPASRPALIAAWPAIGLSFAPALILLALSPTVDLSANTFWDLNGKLDGLVFAVKAYSDGVAAILVATLVLAAAVAWSRGKLIVHPLGPIVLILGLIVYAAMPRVLFDSYMADQRLPVAILFMVFSCLGLIAETPTEHRLVLALACALLALRVAEVQQIWTGDAHRGAEFQQSLWHIDPGSRVLVVSADPERGNGLADFWLTHRVSLASIERSALTTRTFTAFGKQVLHVRKPFLDHVDQLDGAHPGIADLLRNKNDATPTEYTYWHHWPARFDFVYLLFTSPATANPDPAALELLSRSESFHLYRIRKPASPPLLAGTPAIEPAP